MRTSRDGFDYDCLLPGWPHGDEADGTADELLQLLHIGLGLRWQLFEATDIAGRGLPARQLLVDRLAFLKERLICRRAVIGGAADLIGGADLNGSEGVQNVEAGYGG